MHLNYAMGNQKLSVKPSLFLSLIIRSTMFPAFSIFTHFIHMCVHVCVCVCHIFKYLVKLIGHLPPPVNHIKIAR